MFRNLKSQAACKPWIDAITEKRPLDGAITGREKNQSVNLRVGSFIRKPDLRLTGVHHPLLVRVGRGR